MTELTSKLPNRLVALIAWPWSELGYFGPSSKIHRPASPSRISQAGSSAHGQNPARAGEVWGGPAGWKGRLFLIFRRMSNKLWDSWPFSHDFFSLLQSCRLVKWLWSSLTEVEKSTKFQVSCIFSILQWAATSFLHFLESERWRRFLGSVMYPVFAFYLISFTVFVLFTSNSVKVNINVKRENFHITTLLMSQLISVLFKCTFLCLRE